MKEVAEKIEEFPENPPWTMFFDGPLYQKYDEFMKTKDFSKILLNTKLRLANSHGSEVVSPAHSIEIDTWNKEQDLDPTGNTYQYVSEDYFQRNKEDEKRRTRRTRAFIIIGIVIMAALAFGTALVIHYLFIPPMEERNPKNFVNVSFSVNTTAPVTTGISKSISSPASTVTGTVVLKTSTLLPEIIDTLSNTLPTTTFVKPTTTLQEATSILPDTTTSLEETTTILPKTISILQETTTTLLETTSVLQDTTTTLPTETIILQDTTTTLPTETIILQDTTTTLPETTTIVEETTTTLPNTTSVLLDTTTTLQETTTALPERSTELLETTTALPETTTTSPDSTTFLHETTTTLSETTTASSENDTSLTETTTALPETTKTYPETTTTLPETTTTLPETTKTYPETTTTLPETTTTLPETSKTLRKTTTLMPETILQEITTTMPKTIEILQETTTTLRETTTRLPKTTAVQEIPTTLPHTTTIPAKTESDLLQTITKLLETTTTLPSTTATLQETSTRLPETKTLREITTSFLESTTKPSNTTTIFQTTTATFQGTTTLPENYNIIQMQDVTSYTFENAKINCNVKHALKWKSLSVKINKKWRPLEVTLSPSGEIKWSKRKTKRHDFEYEIKKSRDGTGSNITISLIINDVQCRDRNTYICRLQSDIEDGVAESQLIVVAKPSQKITLTLGPSIIEDRAFRMTATWQGGYPIPWANMSWTAFDSNNKSYNLAGYGEYRDYALQEDHHFCQTTLQHSLVVFPKVHLNDTTVIVKPNLKAMKYFVDKSMETYLKQVQPGVEKIMVIPLDYCKNDKKDMSVPHPYVPCTKFLRCISGDMIVQECPIGTCFDKEKQQCA